VGYQMLYLDVGSTPTGSTKNPKALPLQGFFHFTYFKPQGTTIAQMQVGIGFGGVRCFREVLLQFLAKIYIRMQVIFAF
jgi:hypothetical protein